MSKLEKQGKIKLYIFQYEEKINKIKKVAVPSAAFWGEINQNWGELNCNYSDFVESEMYKEITSIVGKENRKDILHLDSAYKTGCDYFLTPDKKDIANNRDKLEPLLGFKIFHSDEIEKFIDEIN